MARVDIGYIHWGLQPPRPTKFVVSPPMTERPPDAKIFVSETCAGFDYGFNLQRPMKLGGGVRKSALL